MRERVAEGSAEEAAAEVADAPTAIRLPPGGTLDAARDARAPARRRQPRRRRDARARAGGDRDERHGSRLARRARGSPTSRCSSTNSTRSRPSSRSTAIYGPITTKAVNQFQAAHAAAEGERRRRRRHPGRGRRGADGGAGPRRDRPQAVQRSAATAFERRKFGHAYAFFTRAGELTDRPGDPVLARAGAAQARRPPRGGDRALRAVPRHRRRHPRRRRRGGARRAQDARGDRRRDRRHRDGQGHLQQGRRAVRDGRLRPRLRRVHEGRRARRPPGHRVLARAVAAQARRPPRGGDRALRAVPRHRRRRPARPTPSAALGRAPRTARPAATRTSTPRPPRASSTRAARCSRHGDYGHAYDEFTRASELADRPGILFSRAQALRKLGGREDEAIALYQQYIDLGEGSPPRGRASRCSSCCGRTAPPRAEGYSEPTTRSVPEPQPRRSLVAFRATRWAAVRREVPTVLPVPDVRYSERLF